MANDEGLRARKKQRTREAIVDAGMKLFAEQGFERTTIAEIAAAADIAPRTFFGYFTSKEEVVFDDFADVYETMSDRLRDRPEGESAVEALRDWIVELDASGAIDDKRTGLRRELVAASAALQAHDRHNLGQFEELLTVAIAEDLGEAPTSLRPRLAAAATTAALGALEQYDALHSDPAGRMAIVDEALAFTAAGIDALRKREPAQRGTR